MTNRPTEERQIECRMCSGLGSNMFETICEACAGEGRVMEIVYADCGHLVISDDCLEGCICEMDVDLQTRCSNLGVMIVAEPWTPRAFETFVCQECGDSLIRQGYKRVVTEFPESNQLKSPFERASEESERDYVHHL